MTKEKLAQKKCLPCEGIGKALNQPEAAELLKATPAWTLAGDHKSISRDYVLKNFVQCVDYVNKIKDIAEREGHHPDVYLTGYKNLKIVIYTHAVNGLTENDFILAAKIDQLG